MDKVVVMLAAFLFVVGCQQREQSAASPAPEPQATVATETAAAPSDGLTIDVTGEFQPASITVPHDQPIRLTFRRGDAPSCGDEIVFADLGIRQKLPKNETTVVELPAQPAGRTLNFTCGMNMMKGTVVVQ